MPSSLQYPLERERDVQRRWGRLLKRTAGPRGCGDLLLGQAGLGDITPPRDRKDDDEIDDDDEEEKEEEEDREPAVIREPDEDE